jgi:ubiquinone/menaquinone biosynthesis C-methylase UbiE
MMQENPLKYSLTTRFKERQILRLLDIKPGDRLLDVGCGIGYLSGLAKARGAEIVGIDMSHHALAHARAQVAGGFVNAGAGELPFAADSFDKVIFADVIEHVPDDRQALGEIVRVAKRDAQIVISTPALEGIFTETWIKTYLHGEEDEFQKNYREGYTTDSLRALMQDCAIGNTHVAYTNFVLSELLLGVTKLAYGSQKARYNSQADLVDVADSWLFKIYKHLVFPIFLALGRIEEMLIGRWAKGHCLIIEGSVLK